MTTPVPAPGPLTLSHRPVLLIIGALMLAMILGTAFMTAGLYLLSLLGVATGTLAKLPPAVPLRR